ncbi:MAG: arylsulfatase [Verrucomicrobiota bacterium]
MALGVFCLPVFATESERPNVILVLTDDQGYGDLSCHGNPDIHTPNIDRLHAESVRLIDFHVNQYCTPSRAALMTGRNASRTGAWRTSSGRTMLHTDEVTMAEVFQQSGYATGIFGKWHLGDSYPHRPQDRGFEQVLWHRCGGLTQISDYWGNDYFDDHYERNGKYEKFEGYCTDVWFENALEFIKGQAEKKKPFFCYLPTNAPHSPYIVDEKYAAPYRGNPNVAKPKFFGMIANIDKNMGQLRGKLEQWGIAENTILIYMTDNGTSGGIKPSHNPDGWPETGFNAGMRGKKASMYDGGHRVPCFVHWPGGGLTGGRDVPQLTAHYDWLPTLMEMCGLTRPRGRKLDGRSLLPLLQGKAGDWPQRTMVRQYQGGVFFRFAPQAWRESVVMTERWRLVNGDELYDIKKDPGQRKDIAGEHSTVVDNLRAKYSDWWREVESRVLTPVRNHVGNVAENPVMLSAQEWYMEPFGNPITSQGQVSELRGIEGPWLLNVERSGEYEITLCQFPKEAQRAIKAEKSWIRISGQQQSAEIKPGSNGITFKIKLGVGPARLETAFIGAQGKRTSAYYAYVRYLGDFNN